MTWTRFPARTIADAWQADNYDRPARFRAWPQGTCREGNNLDDHRWRRRPGCLLRLNQWRCDRAKVTRNRAWNPTWKTMNMLPSRTLNQLTPATTECQLRVMPVMRIGISTTTQASKVTALPATSRTV